MKFLPKSFASDAVPPDHHAVTLEASGMTPYQKDVSLMPFAACNARVRSSTASQTAHLLCGVQVPAVFIDAVQAAFLSTHIAEVSTGSPNGETESVRGATTRRGSRSG